MRPPKLFVVHHSADVGTFQSIRKAHLARGWKDIGYNLVIDREATLHIGRPIGVTPAANGKGKNAGTIACCVIGDNTREGYEWTPLQKARLADVWMGLRHMFEGIGLAGHRDLKATECPGLDIHKLLR